MSMDGTVTHQAVVKVDLSCKPAVRWVCTCGSELYVDHGLPVAHPMSY